MAKPTLADLKSFFTPSTAIVFFDAQPRNNPANTMQKLVGYMKTYKPDLADNTTWGGNTLPYCEQYSSGAVKNVKVFKGNIGMTKSKSIFSGLRKLICDVDALTKFGTGPVQTIDNKANPFSAKFSNGIRVQFAILPHADWTSVGDTVGAIHIWAVPADTNLTETTPNPSIPVYSAGKDTKIYRGYSENCQSHYIATLGAKPFRSARSTNNKGG